MKIKNFLDWTPTNYSVYSIERQWKNPIHVPFAMFLLDSHPCISVNSNDTTTSSQSIRCVHKESPQHGRQSCCGNYCSLLRHRYSHWFWTTNQFLLHSIPTFGYTYLLVQYPLVCWVPTMFVKCTCCSYFIRCPPSCELFVTSIIWNIHITSFDIA